MIIKNIKIIILTILLVCIFSNFLACDETINNLNNQEIKLYKIRMNGKWGFIDKEGKIIIEPLFDEADDFYEDRASVKINDKWGLIDTEGNIVVTPEYENITSFREGRAAVRIEGRKGYKYIDKDGNYITESDFDSKHWYWFHDGLACVVNEDGLIGFINKEGRLVIPYKFVHKGIATMSSDIRPNDYGFREGLAYVYIDGKFGYINTKGEIAIKPQFDWAGYFHNGYAIVIINKKYKYIDKQGNFLFDIEFNRAFYFEIFENELITLVVNNDKNGYINEKGEYILGPIDEYLHGFSEGLFLISTNSGYNKKYGYIDKTGNVIITPQFYHEFSFNEGLAAVSIWDDENKREKWGYIDKTGSFVIEPQFDYAGSFDSNGIALVRIINFLDEFYREDAKWGYINKKGEYIWPLTK